MISPTPIFKDRRFMRRYQQLPDMQVPDAPRLPRGLADSDAIAALSALSLRCGGCGAKVGASVLTRALQRAAIAGRDDVLIGLDDPDDAAVVRTADGTSHVHTIDFFRAIVDDSYVFGQIAANHALGDVYAMGGEPQSALALVTIPYGPEGKVEDTLTHVLASQSMVSWTGIAFCEKRDFVPAINWSSPNQSAPAPSSPLTCVTGPGVGGSLQPYGR